LDTNFENPISVNCLPKQTMGVGFFFSITMTKGGGQLDGKLNELDD
jgi:hypothetical protein